MRTRTTVCLILLLAAGASWAARAQPRATPMGFFVTSTGIDGGSANLGGLQGADAHCQALARQAGVGTQREWRAYLSTAASATHAGVDARDRIGTGPWHNAKGELIATDVDALHSDRARIDRHTALTEKGEPVAGRQHDMLTGSDDKGRLAHAYGAPATCGNWTQSGDGHAMMGHHDRFEYRGTRFPHWRRSWVAAHPSRGCDATRIAQTGSAGLFYCFASDTPKHAEATVSAEQTSPVTFRRGVNIAHWLSHNYLPDAPYGAPWFDEEDIAWIAAQGFDHVRLRIAGDRVIDRNGDIDQAHVAPIDNALRWAREHRVGVVLSMFSLPGFRHGTIGEPAPQDRASPFTDEDTGDDASYVWWQLARRYANEGPYLRFELLHRPQAPDAQRMRAYNETLLAAIRTSNPRRVVYLTSRDMDMASLGEVMESEAIASDWNIALAIEDTGMRVFTAQHDSTWPLVRFPGTVPDMSAAAGATDSIRQESGRVLTVKDIDDRFDRFATQARGFAWGREIYLAEFGVFERADDDSAKRYIAAVRAAAERNGISWAVYDYHSGCAVRDDDGKPTRILQALALKPDRPRAMVRSLQPLTVDGSAVRGVRQPDRR